ncbi:DUF1810 family protein [Nakamurella sp. YIM 132087]|uniref:DUF1810 family protein n=1 Tax=Nakamurella alba TaxID=2665158 RepID=A0A7K1FLK9_9ACTN|nr:DUF1810 domain-containing protein [Nakamurella alba]MTD15031.1 DUF1810 family protein [Nakamurella alba]
MTDLERFVTAQGAGGTYFRAVAELRAGDKRSHWMWFVFPQLAGLGMSAMSQRYAIGSLAEAREYLDHPVLGPRLAECCGILLDLENVTATDVLGGIDAVKLRSCATLFHRAAPDRPEFTGILEKYFDGEPDPATDQLLR